MPTVVSLLSYSWVFLLIFIMNSAFAASQVSDKALGSRSLPEMLDYYQLMQLSEKDRDHYMREVLSLLHNLERPGTPFLEPKSTPKNTAASELWRLLLGGAEAVAADSCLQGQDSKTWQGQGYCIQECPKGYTRVAFTCPMLASSERIVCKADCVRVSEKPTWEKSGPPGPGKSSSGYDDGAGKISPGTAPDIQAQKELPADRKDSPSVETEKKDTVKLDPKQACYEIACPSEDSKYRFKVKEDFNSRVSGKKDERCINAGMIGKYSIQGNKKCQPVQKYEIGQTKLTCPAGKTMCNPLLFGLAKSSPPKAHCIDIGLEMTQRCYNKAGGVNGAREFWKNPAFSHEDIAREWKNLVTHLREDLCTEDASARYHCLECALIAKRLAELNKMVDGCPKENKCGDKVICASRWNTVRPLESEDLRGTR